MTSTEASAVGAPAPDHPMQESSRLTRPPLARRPPSQDLDPGSEDDRNRLVKRMAAVLGNVAVLTALLVYFGWVRSEVHSRLLGFDESVLGMTTRDYLLRSVRPVLVLLLVICGSALLWLFVDPPIVRRLRDHGVADPWSRLALRLSAAAPILLPASVWLLGYVAPEVAFVAFPVSIAGGLLLLLYGRQLRRLLPDALAAAAVDREPLLRAVVGVVVGICVFWSAANYATVEGTRLADDFAGNVPALPTVTVYSTDRLQLDVPGASEEVLREEGTYGFRYTGLRLLEHTGGNYFFVTDAWQAGDGTIVMLPDEAPLRLEFVLGR